MASPDAVDRAIALGVVQMLWDRTEGAGYVHHIVDHPCRARLPKTY